MSRAAGSLWVGLVHRRVHTHDNTVPFDFLFKIRKRTKFVNMADVAKNKLERRRRRRRALDVGRRSLLARFDDGDDVRGDNRKDQPDAAADEHEA